MIDGDADAALGAAEQAVVADAAARELSPEGRAGGEVCANCGASLEGRHCHVCGQVADDMRRPFWSLVADALEGLFSLDGKFFKTIPALLFRPGEVSAAYLKGARARFVQPFRLYLFSALAFLLAVSLTMGDWTAIDFDEFGPPDPPPALEASEPANADASTTAEGAPQFGPDFGEAGPLGAPPPALAPRGNREAWKCWARRAWVPEDPAPDCDAADYEDYESNVQNWTTPDWPIATRRFILQQTVVVIDDPNRFLEAVNRWTSRVLIGLFPVYAMLLGLTHIWKRRFFAYDHIIVSLHAHAFVFLELTLLIVLSTILPVPLLILTFLGWTSLYVYRVHRKVYGCSRPSSAARTLLLGVAYTFLLSFVPAILFISGFLTA